MNIYEYTPGKATGLRDAVIALGFFDGVHIAHRELIQKTVEIAKRENLSPTVFTFTAEGAIKSDAPRLYSTEERLTILSDLGIENVILVNFKDIAGFEAEDFVKTCLIDHFGAKAVVAGYNFRFGKGARGNREILTSLMSEAGLRAFITEEITFGEKTISSTLIRAYLAEGKIEIANRLLGKPYFISGIVESGNHVGKKIGFPTINIPLREGYVQLGRGVYFTVVQIGDDFYRGITNVGTCPTFDERQMHTETYILNYNNEIYGEEVQIYFLEYIREERKFKSPEELREEIGRNMRWAMEREIKWQEIGLK